MLIFSIDPALLEAVDAFRFKHRFTARSGAVKFLLTCALKLNPKPEAVDLQREEWRSRRPKAKSKGRSDGRLTLHRLGEPPSTRVQNTDSLSSITLPNGDTRI